MKYLIAAIAAFIFGWYVNGLRYEAKIQETLNISLEKQAQDIQTARAKEQEYRVKADNATKQAKEAISIVSAHYRKLLADGLPKSTDTTNPDSVPANTAASSRVQRNNCRCVKYDRTKLQRLYEQQLKISEKCDALNAKYNYLRDFYLNLSETKE